MPQNPANITSTPIVLELYAVAASTCSIACKTSPHRTKYFAYMTCILILNSTVNFESGGAASANACNLAIYFCATTTAEALLAVSASKVVSIPCQHAGS